MENPIDWNWCFGDTHALGRLHNMGKYGESTRNSGAWLLYRNGWYGNYPYALEIKLLDVLLHVYDLGSMFYSPWGNDYPHSLAKNQRGNRPIRHHWTYLNTESHTYSLCIIIFPISFSRHFPESALRHVQTPFGCQERMDEVQEKRTHSEKVPGHPWDPVVGSH